LVRRNIVRGVYIRCSYRFLYSGEMPVGCCCIQRHTYILYMSTMRTLK
jgi:hypothetical protein